MSTWLSHHFLWNWNLEMSVYEECRKTSGPGEKPLKPTYGIDTTWFEPGPHCWEASVLTTAPSLAFKCPASNSCLPLLPWNTNAGYFREEPSTSNQHPPPPPPHPPSLIMIFFSSGSVQNVAGLRPKLHVNPDYNFSVLVDS